CGKKAENKAGKSPGLPREPSLIFVIEQIRDMERMLDLLPQHLFHARVVVPQRIHADTGKEIEVSLVGAIDQRRAASAVDQYIVSRVGSENVFAFQFFDVAELHEPERLAHVNSL